MAVDEVQQIIDAYDVLIKGIDQTAISNTEGRAYGGIIRAGKGELVESIAKHLIMIAWERLGQPFHRISTEKINVTIKIKDGYTNRIKNQEIKRYVEQNIEEYEYTYKPDVSVSIDGKYVIVVECKSYTENAMLKRILVDSSLIRLIHPNMISILFQLESQLGGDYSELNEITYGSKPTHTLLSYFDVDLQIITLLKRDRKVNKEIHKKEFYKPLTRENLENAINILKEILTDFIPVQS